MAPLTVIYTFNINTINVNGWVNKKRLFNI